MNQSGLKSCLVRKLQLIKDICTNNESQQRLIKRRNFRAVRRLLRERDALIAELTAVNNQLNGLDPSWQQQPTWQPIAQTVSQLQTAMLNSCRQVIYQAAAERRDIAAELKKLKNAQQLKSHYAPSWQGITAGRRLSVKG